MHECVIVGNGLAGLACALAFAQQDMPCVLIGPESPEKTDTDTIDGRTTAIMDDGIAFLQALGVWNTETLHATPLSTMRLIADNAHIEFHSQEIGLEQFGFNIPNALLKQSLLRAVKAHKKITVINSTVIDIQRNGEKPVAITCANGWHGQTHLVIGADGRTSTVRQAAEIAVTETHLDQYALVCVVDADQPHDNTSTEWYHAGGPFTLVPLPGQRMAVVYCDVERTILDLQTLSPDALGDYFTDFSNSFYGSLRVTSAVQAWPIKPQRAAHFTSSRIALIAEAAHVMPPLAAQGFNASLRDIQALLKVVTEARNVGLDYGTVATLRGYESARGADIRLRTTGVDWLNMLIRRDDTLGRRMQAFGFAVLDRLPWLKRPVMRAALAPHTHKDAA